MTRHRWSTDDGRNAQTLFSLPALSDPRDTVVVESIAARARAREETETKEQKNNSKIYSPLEDASELKLRGHGSSWNESQRGGCRERRFLFSPFTSSLNLHGDFTVRDSTFSMRVTRSVGQNPLTSCAPCYMGKQCQGWLVWKTPGSGRARCFFLNEWERASDE